MDVPALKLTRPVRAVLRVLLAGRGRKLAVAHIATDGRLAAATVRVALADMGKAGLVQHVLAPGADRQPPRTVYWLTHDGYNVAAGQPEGHRGE